MGAGIAASPHLRRAKDPPVFVSFGDPKASCSSILAHQLRRRFGSWIPIRRRVPLASAALLGPIVFRVAWLPEGDRVSRKSGWLFRRLFQLVRTGTEILVHRLPVEIGPSAPSSSFCVVAGASGEAGTSVPIT